MVEIAEIIDNAKWETLGKNYEEMKETDMIKIVENPGEENIYKFSRIVGENELLYQHFKTDEKDKIQEWLNKWGDFFSNKLSSLESALDKNKQIDFIDTLCVLISIQKYRKFFWIENQRIDTKKYEKTINQHIMLRLDTYSKNNREYNGSSTHFQWIDNIGVFSKILTLIKEIPIEDKFLYNKKLWNYIDIANEDLQKNTGLPAINDNVFIIENCLLTHEIINNWAIDIAFQKKINTTLTILQSLINKDGDQEIESEKIFHLIKLSQKLWINKDYTILLQNFWKKINASIEWVDTKQDVLISNPERLYNKLSGICSEHNETHQKLELKESYQIKKKNDSINLTFNNEHGEETKIIIQIANTGRIKVICWKENILLQQDFLIDKIEQGKIEDIVKEIKEKEDNNKAKEQIIKKFDLPKDEPIQYTRIFQNNDVMGVVPWTLLFSEALEQELQKKYKINATDPKITGNPETIIKSTIKDNYPAQKNFFFDLYAHGKPTHLSFEKPLTIDVFIQLSKEYPDCKFFISTIGCYGWGFMESIKNQKQLKNLYVFTQTKTYLPNTPEGWSTPYYGILLKALQEGKTYGEAVFEADKIANELNYSDAESFLWWEYIAELRKQQEESNKI